MESCLTLCVFDREVCFSFLHKNLDRLLVLVESGCHHWGVSFGICEVWVGTMIEQKRNKERTIKRKRGDHERRHTVLILMVDTGAFLEQDPADAIKAVLDRLRKGSASTKSRRVGIRALFKKKSCCLHVIFHDGVDQRVGLDLNFSLIFHSLGCTLRRGSVLVGCVCT